MLVAGATVLGRQRPGQPLGPAVEARLDIAGPQPIADRLQPLRGLAGEKTVVEALEADPFAPQLLFGPLVAVEAELHGVGQITADLEESRAPLEILEVEVEVVDVDVVALEGEVHPPGGTYVLLAAERAGALLGHAQKDHAFRTLEPITVLRCHVVLALATLEAHDPDRPLPHEAPHRLDEALAQAAKQRRRHHRLA